jgi:hypothetical protein
LSILHTIHIHTAPATGSVSWKPTKESIPNHKSSTHLRKHVEAWEESDCFDNKMCIPMACNTKWIGNQLSLEAGENIKGTSLSRNNTINGISSWKHLKVDTSWHSFPWQ